MHAISTGVLIAGILGLLTGAALAQANVCMMRAASELSHGRVGAVGGLLAASAAGAVVFFLSGLAGWHQHAPWTWPGLLTILGAVLFAVGARLNAACSIGTVGRLASGDLGAFATLAGMLAALAILPRATVQDMRPPWAGQVEISWVAGMALFVIVFVLVARRSHSLRGLAAPVLLGAIAALLYGLHSQVTWLELATEAFSGAGSWSLAAAGFLCLLVGAFAVTYARGRVRLQLPERRRAVREFTGGAFMGAGSLLIPGATDALAFYGVPSGSPHALVAWLVLFGTIVLSFWLFPVDPQSAQAHSPQATTTASGRIGEGAAAET